MAAPTFDGTEILRTIQVFHEKNGIVELRIPQAGKFRTVIGYDNDPKYFVDSVAVLAEDKFPGYYFTLNPIKPELVARSANTYTKYAQSGTSTSDSDVIRRRWLPIDLDPIRAAGISSTDKEHTAALEKTVEIRQWLIDNFGWSANAFVRADSGNGGHLVVRIDLPNDKESLELITRCLDALDLKLSNEAIKVDTGIANAARIWKIYGTFARKSSDIPERPHRMGKLL